VFGQTGGYRGVGPNMDRAVLTRVIESSFPKPSVFAMIPFNDGYVTGKEFSDVLAARFRNLEEVIAERRIAAEFESCDESSADLMTAQDMQGTWDDVKYAVDLMFRDEHFVKPVRSLWEVNNYYGIHCVDVSLAALSLAAGADIYAGRREELIAVGVAALLHDIGKEKYPELYTKLGEFDETDHRLMREHTKDSVLLVRDAVKALPEPIRYMILRGIEEHHENWDGTGYPFGFKGDQISKAGQVIRIADSLESGTSLIRAAMYNGEAKTQYSIMEDIAGRSGTWYSPYFVRVLQRGFDEHLIEQRRIEMNARGGSGTEYHA
jgi:HD-GYP domain-containing protein (c-di-GMP phosphodiesterase class II)